MFSFICFSIYSYFLEMTTESYEQFADRIVSEVTSYFVKIDCHKVKITSDKIKIQMYCYENWEEVDFKVIHSICNDITKANKEAFKQFNFSTIVFFAFHGEWSKISDKY